MNETIDKTALLLARAAAIDVDDAQATHVGLQLAGLLNLPRIACGPEKGRYRTSWGTKTSIGLARTVLRVIAEGAAS